MEWSGRRTGFLTMSFAIDLGAGACARIDAEAFKDRGLSRIEDLSNQMRGVDQTYIRKVHSIGAS